MTSPTVMPAQAGIHDVCRLIRIVGKLPVQFEHLKIEAAHEGYKFLDRLATDWESGKTRFENVGEALLVAYIGDDLAGIGGITHDPVMRGALRMRRFYVGLSYRRRGIGASLVNALLSQPSEAGRTVTVNAGVDSAAFWERLDFVPDRVMEHTHVLVT